MTQLRDQIRNGTRYIPGAGPLHQSEGWLSSYRAEVLVYGDESESEYPDFDANRLSDFVKFDLQRLLHATSRLCAYLEKGSHGWLAEDALIWVGYLEDNLERLVASAEKPGDDYAYPVLS